jgi:hypothetical protein
MESEMAEISGFVRSPTWAITRPSAPSTDSERVS